ncbi:uncharacterized protein [Haliotis cracherodii]|uniref:uncharacterized protein n=1 Tax=Haliotis cracherodii TaxID=6455 RepID=UPI0039E78812
MKDLVRTDYRPVPSIFQEELNKLRTTEADDILQTVPTLYSVGASLYRARAKTLPPLPKQRQDIQLPDSYQRTVSSQDFLLHTEDDNKLMIFATSQNIRHLSASNVYSCDGTFCMCPSRFYQIYTINACVHNKMVPLVFALLPDKKQSTYLRLFTILNQMNLQLQPNFVSTDFETAAQNAAKIEFPCQIKGSALPLLRLCGIEDFWLHALESVDMDIPGVRNFADYVTEQWVDGGERFMWNHFDTVGPRTTNHVEVWHSKLSKLAACHSNIFKFANLIKSEQNSAELTVMQLNAGGIVRPTKKVYRQLEERLEQQKRLLVTGVTTTLIYGDNVSHLVGL